MIREFIHGGETLQFDLTSNEQGVVITLNGTPAHFAITELSGGRLVLQTSEGQMQARVARGKDRVWVWLAGSTYEFMIPSADGDGSAHGTESKDDMRAPMPGTLRKLLVQAGDSVEEGQVVAVVEAMKMEHQIRAPRAGVVARTEGIEGAIVDADAILVALERTE